MIIRYGVLKSWHDKETGDKQWSFLEIHPLSDEEIEKAYFQTNTPIEGVGKNITNGMYAFARAVEEAIRGE